MPNYLITEPAQQVILRNFEGVITSKRPAEHHAVLRLPLRLHRARRRWRRLAHGSLKHQQRYLEPNKLAACTQRQSQEVREREEKLWKANGLNF